MAELLTFAQSRQQAAVNSRTLSLFLHTDQHDSSMPFVQEWKLIDILTGSISSGFNTTYVWEIPDYGDLVGHLYLKLVIPALTGGATNARLVDYGGLYSIRSVDYYIGSTQFNSITADEIYAFHQRFRQPEDIYAFENLCGGNLSQTTRINNATGTQTFYIPLLSPFARTPLNNQYPPHFFPVRYLGRKNAFRVYVNFQPTSFFLAADSGTPNASISTLQILASYYHVNQPQKMALASLTSKGYQIKIEDTMQKVTAQQLQAGSNSYQINISNIRSPVSEIYFILRNASDVQTNYGNNPTNLQPLSSFSLSASGVDIIARALVDDIMLRHIVNRVYVGFDGIRIYCIPFNMFPMKNDDGTFSGSIDFASLVNPTLTLNFSSNLANNMQLDLYSLVPNILFISDQIVRKEFA